MERKRLLNHALKLWRQRGDDHWIATTLRFLSMANKQLGLHREGIQQAEEAVEIFKRQNNKSGQAQSWYDLARLLHNDGQLEAAEETASRVIGLLSVEDDQFMDCQSHHLLGNIYSSKDETAKAIDHYETALGIASSFNWHTQQSIVHHSLARLFLSKDRFDDTHTHVECAKSNAIDDPYRLGFTMKLQARIWYKQHRFEEAKSEALAATDVFKKLGAAKEVERCRAILRDIERQ